MPKLPHPPARLPALVAEDVSELPAGRELWRLYFAGGPHATTWNGFRFFGPLATARFDHHLPPPRPQERGIVYAAESGQVCLAEVFQLTRTIDRVRREPWLASFALAAGIRLLDLAGLWPTRAGASQALATGRRDVARRWSGAIYAHYPEIEGLLYRSSINGGGTGVALFERAAHALPRRPAFHAPLTHPGMAQLLRSEAARLGYVLV